MPCPPERMRGLARREQVTEAAAEPEEKPDKS
jgi:hypothetical protein